MNVKLTDKESSIFTPDPLDTDFPIYVCSKEMSRGTLNDFFKRNRSYLTIIQDSDSLEQHTNQAYRRIRYEKAFSTLAEGISIILQPLKFSYKDFSVSVSKVSSNRKPSDNQEQGSSILYIKEDKIHPTQIAKLASLYTEMPYDSRPIMIFEPKSESLSLKEDMHKLNNNIIVHPLGQTKSWRHEATKIISKAGDITSFTKNFMSHSYTACDFDSISLDTTEFIHHTSEVIIQRLAAESLSIKSYDNNGNKFGALPVAIGLLKKLDIAKEYMKADYQIRYLLSLKAVINLWISYIDESFTEGIDNSLAIAEFLENENLKSHCFRLSHLISGYSSQTGDLVSKAAQYFRERDESESYIYCQNNKLLNQLGTKHVDLDAFSELVDFSTSQVPYLDRLSTVANNAGTAYLVNGKYKG
ncbi:hypothetical protein [Magnetofaba australis]|uniref:Uncharacterized protein n=1 Tax=Magnetofaba australis IT-1 TaxID=1434232 RepID=A0A1Y2JZG0_9PROT|nr:hypothetical protein [Magnetofaba australis]OSM00288.1 hypothetical protein MAIT1_05460 [Magnetofaba australis IT-1]